MSTWAIILAAGAGTRMGTPKALLKLDGKPMLWYSIAAFQQSENIDAIVIVTREQECHSRESGNPVEMDPCFRRGDMRWINEISSKIRFVVPGGKERQDSVREGMKKVPPDASVVIVHDAARPLVTAELIDSVIGKAKETGAALAAIPTKDTIKLTTGNGFVRETLKRNLLWSAQTPQAFKAQLFRKALQEAQNDSFYGTDCSSLLERIGIRVSLVQGSPENIKVTTPADLLAAEAILKQRLHVY